jgi:hypothetical protein
VHERIAIRTRRRAFHHFLGGNATQRHFTLGGIDVQSAGREMVDARAAKAHYVGDQPMRVVQRR